MKTLTQINIPFFDSGLYHKENQFRTDGSVTYAATEQSALSSVSQIKFLSWRL